VPTRTILQRLGDEVRERRLQRHLSQEALADESGLSLNTLKKLEWGNTNCQLLTLFGVASGLKTSLSDLIAGIERRQ
jgi:transcriptional regulator with XRE-family HTH domain